ncbi:MAG TPA: trehalose-phosphatase, partial [Planctomycetota bacterium]|nr:trehalose-phosphatase [Planctomycetota bacterium]
MTAEVEVQGARLAPPGERFWRALAAAPARLLLLDYDGTLAPFRVDRRRARPAPGVVAALRKIMARRAAEVVIV